jgi:hypothetical protein
MKQWLINIGSYLLDPIRKIGLSRVSDNIVNYSNKNPWFKVLITFIIVIILVTAYYVMDQKLF